MLGGGGGGANRIRGDFKENLGRTKMSLNPWWVKIVSKTIHVHSTQIRAY